MQEVSMQVVLAQPRGFCAGVERAIEIVERALVKYGPPIYVRHEIVHNRHVVEDLRTRGAVFVDDIDVRDYHTERLWSSVGLVPQRGYLFSGTVADNLRYGKADASDAEMWDALRVACADTFVAAHPDGLEMRVAQGGINFSGGQRQRLAIARAVIRRPEIYLFDDAFSALDVHTDALVRERLREMSAGATVIIVAQRISTVVAAEQVIVIDDGRVVGTGTHESLLADCPPYTEFADSQAVSR